MSRYRNPTKRDWVRKGVYAGLFCTGSVAGGLFLRPPAYILFITATFMLLVQWHAVTSAYRCARCGFEFAISAWDDFLSPRPLEKKFVRCPKCGCLDWTEELKKV